MPIVANYNSRQPRSQRGLTARRCLKGVTASVPGTNHQRPWTAPIPARSTARGKERRSLRRGTSRKAHLGHAAHVVPPFQRVRAQNFPFSTVGVWSAMVVPAAILKVHSVSQTFADASPHPASISHTFQPFADDPLTVEELAVRLKVKPSWVFEQTRTRAGVRNRDPLPHVKMGRYLRFSWAEVSAWLTRQRRKA